MDLLKNKKNIKNICIIFIALFIPILIEKFVYTNAPFDIYRYMIFLIVTGFIGLHFIFKISDLYDFMYRKRYHIGIALFAFLVIFQYHGSSIVLYDDFIEPNHYVNYGGPLLGHGNEIRSDEWAGFTPTMLSQATEKNNFSTVNKSMMGGNVNDYRVDLFPGLPTKSFDMLLFPKRIGFLFLPLENAFSWYWFIEYFLTFFATFEFCMLITKKNKFYSLVGAILVTFSAAVQWWDFTNIIYHGMFAVILFDKLLKTNKKIHKILYASGIGYFGAAYVLTMYPAFAIPFAYFFLGIVIWDLLVTDSKNKWKDLLLAVLIALPVMALLLFAVFYFSKEVYELMNNTVYPGARFSTGGFGWKDLYNYILCIIAPYSNVVNASATSTFLSFYPIPLILGLILLIKNRKEWKKDLLLPILLFIILFLSIWNFVELPRFVAKITLMYMSTVERSNVIVSFTSMILLIHILSNYSNKFKFGVKDVILFIISISFIYYAYNVDNSLYHFHSMPKMIAALLIYGILVYMFLSLKFNKALGVLLSLLVLITGLSVHPVNRTLNSIYDKPVSKEIRKITKSDPDAIWLSMYASIFIPNYALANGATVLNSINYYPNYDLIDKVDKEHEYEEVWNRFGHVYAEFVDEETKFELIQADYYKLQLNINDLCTFNVKYLISYVPNLNEMSTKRVTIEKIYEKDNIFIYKDKCNNVQNNKR